VKPQPIPATPNDNPMSARILHINISILLPDASPQSPQRTSSPIH
jgi:hypothetical protein